MAVAGWWEEEVDKKNHHPATATPYYLATAHYLGHVVSVIGVRTWR